MSKLKVLYVASEIRPFTDAGPVAKFLHSISQKMQEKGLEVRVLVPRFGVINERRNRLHEVVRLSGINIPMESEEKPLIIKVASIPQTRLQVYFIDNEDYFQRKSIFFDENGRFHEDNDKRAIFFCKGVLETIRKLGWAPNIIHCNDWMSSLISLFVKTSHANDPVFSKTKCVLTLHDDCVAHTFDKEELIKNIGIENADSSVFEALKEPNVAGLVRLGAAYADHVSKETKSEHTGLESTNAAHHDLTKDINEHYYALYEQLVK